MLFSSVLLYSFQMMAKIDGRILGRISCCLINSHLWITGVCRSVKHMLCQKLNMFWKQEGMENKVDTINAFKGHWCIYRTTENQTVKRGVWIMTFNRYWKSLAQVTNVYHIEHTKKKSVWCLHESMDNYKELHFQEGLWKYIEQRMLYVG